MSDGCWRTHIPEGEEILWTRQPHQGYFPPHVGWAYRLLILSLGLAWLASPWFADTLRDYWKLIGSTGFVIFLIWYDRPLRRRRVYVVTTRNAWWISKIFKPKHVPIDHALNYHRSGQSVVFSRRLFLVFEYLSDPNAALAALNQAREASA